LNPALSGERFVVVYHLRGTREEATAKAEDICLEDTVELPLDLVPDGPIRSEILGRVENIRPISGDVFEARISFAVETTAHELTQLLNIAFGNISLKPGLRIERFEFPDNLLESFPGPRFGRDGWRKMLGAALRPLLCSAIKPMGMSAHECADLAGRLALGGIDIIKDDHGLTDQPFCRFEERVGRCAEAIQKANAETGMKCVYMANVTAPQDEVFHRARVAKNAGAGALLISPGLTGYDMMRLLAEDDDIDMPIMCHPAFQGSFVTHPENGISHHALFAQLARLAGADATIFPNYGGRFSFTREECAKIALETQGPMGHIKPIFPTPAGGMTLQRIADMARVYSGEVIYLIGGGLQRHETDLIEACRDFRRMAERSIMNDDARRP